MLKNLIKKTVLKLFPELNNKTHLPQLAIVMAVPSPPTAGQTCTEEMPYYAVNCQLLKSDLSIDEDMPLLQDVPVALSGASIDRGLAALPQPGAIVEIAFAYGLQSHPFIRSVLPLNQKLPTIDGLSMRWQQNILSYQEVDKQGNWKQFTSLNISRNANKSITDSALISSITTSPIITREAKDIIMDISENVHNTTAKVIAENGSEEISQLAPKIWTGSPTINLWTVLSEFMATTIQAVSNLQPQQSKEKQIQDCLTNMSTQKGQIDLIKK